MPVNGPPPRGQYCGPRPLSLIPYPTSPPAPPKRYVRREPEQRCEPPAEKPDNSWMILAGLFGLPFLFGSCENSSSDE